MVDPTATARPSAVSQYTAPDRVVEALSSQLLSALQAINDRNFDRFSSPVYKNVAPFWQATIEWIPSSVRTFTMDEWVGWYRQMAEKYPDFQVVPGEIEAIGSGEKWELFLTLDVYGIHPDVVSQTVLRSEYRVVEGKWMAVFVENLPGMGMDGGR